MEHQIPKGTFDILPYGNVEGWQLSDAWQAVEAVIREITATYNYGEIRTPIYEMTGLFDRGVGETSDIVTKEMFTFQDKGGRSITLRPEGTSSVMRSFIENRLANLGNVHKLYYIGPMFRYERPQSGRYRQHHQFGVEAIGVKGPEQDAEVIDLLYRFYQMLGLQGLSVHINTVGDTESRTAYKNALLKYLEPHFDSLSMESKTRFTKNPLRILDSKDPKDKEIVKDAPSILNFLTKESGEHFERLQKLLTEIQIPFVVNDKIVRGLDYYHKTVFEVLAGDLGAQNTIGAGGRFDGLISTFGGADLPAVGFATGLERVLQVLLAQKIELGKSKKTHVYFVPLDDESKDLCFKFVTECRHAKIAADIELSSRKMQTAIQSALKIGAKYCAIIGSDERSKGVVQLKNLVSREQREVPIYALLDELKHD